MQHGNWFTTQTSHGYSSGFANTTLPATTHTAFAESQPQGDPLENAGIRAGEIVAWRGWWLVDGYLRSVTMRTVWAPGEVMKGAPTDHGVEGVYGFKDAADALTMVATYAMTGMFSEVGVVGHVFMWGQVIEHENGYRAEFAQVKSIDYIMPADKHFGYHKVGLFRRRKRIDRLEQLRELYGVSSLNPRDRGTKT